MKLWSIHSSKATNIIPSSVSYKVLQPVAYTRRDFPLTLVMLVMIWSLHSLNIHSIMFLRIHKLSNIVLALARNTTGLNHDNPILLRKFLRLEALLTCSYSLSWELRAGDWLNEHGYWKLPKALQWSFLSNL